ncbi:MAG TPA: hypothetical protein VJP06_05050, partial [Thermoplasmata archaeon]|nr:hypothetical protein [Thermoplasmata archaeon]
GTVGGRTVVTNISRMADLTVSGNVVHYNLKWDQEITGWTFEPGNTVGNAHRILLEVGAIVGNWIPAALVDAWFETRVMDRMGETGTAQYTTAAGAQTSNESSGTYAAARRLQNPAVDFGGNWTRIARLEWVGTSVVDGVNRPVFGQIVAGLRFATLHDGNLFAGFVLLAGLSFRGGATIVHDPTVSSDVQADLALPGTTAAGPAPIFLAAVGAVVVIAALLAIAFLVRKRRKKDELPPPPPDE